MTGSEIRELRRILGWSQQRLAQELNVYYSSVSRWERMGNVKIHPVLTAKLEELRDKTERG